MYDLIRSGYPLVELLERYYPPGLTGVLAGHRLTASPNPLPFGSSANSLISLVLRDDGSDVSSLVLAVACTLLVSSC